MDRQKQCEPSQCRVNFVLYDFCMGDIKSGSCTHALHSFYIDNFLHWSLRDSSYHVQALLTGQFHVKTAKQLWYIFSLLSDVFSVLAKI